MRFAGGGGIDRLQIVTRNLYLKQKNLHNTIDLCFGKELRLYNEPKERLYPHAQGHIR